ncbi:MAG: RIP metalloprotease RseP [bacterium]
MSFFAPALYLVIALSILVLVHEWGHFIVARRTGVRVLKFSIGFGPEVVGVTRGETRWCLSAIPFGGYVKFAGDNPEESRDGASDEFLSQTVGVRSAIVLAGPVMNYVLAIALFAGVLYMAGEPVAHSTKIGEVVAGSVAESVGIQAGDVVRSVNGTHVEDWDSFTHELYRIGPAQDYKFEMDRKGQTVEIAGRTKADRGFGPDSPLGVIYHRDAVLGYVKRGDPAWKAGLRTGDRILEYDGRKADRWADFADYAADHAGKGIAITWQRDRATLRGTLQPESRALKEDGGETRTIGAIGAQPFVETRHVGLVEAVRGGAEETWSLTSHVVAFIPKLPILVVQGLGRLVTGRPAQDEGLGGPLRMAEMFGEAARWGIVAFLVMMANISTQLAIFNLLPIPVLDGGHLALHLVEVVTRRPPSLRVKVILQQIGFALLVLLMLSVTVMDVGRALG